MSDIGFTEEELQTLIDNIDQLTPQEAAEVESMLADLEVRQARAAAHDDLIAFCRYMQPDYKVGKHHRILADKLMALESGIKDRAAVNMPPRHGKSQLVSIYFPAWFIGRNPTKKVMMVSHTTDLAVDFGRKVRNLIDDAKFQEIFPDIHLAADSKSAGRWNTNHKGEYYACILPDTKIRTQRGIIPAKDVVPGDKVLSHSGFVPVYSTMCTSHDATFYIAGAGYSAEHPIWTVNRGWVEAENVLPSDVLTTESILDTLKASFMRVYDGLVEHPNVSALVQHQESLHESEERKVQFLWWARNLARQALVRVRSVLCRHGGPSVSYAYSWSDRQRRALQSGELSMGDRRATAEQQAKFSENRNAYVGATCSTVGFDPRGVTISDVYGAGCFESGEEAESKHERASEAVHIGWFRGKGAQLIARSCSSTIARKPKTGAKVYLESVREAAQKVFGVLLGVRAAGDIRKETHEPREFVNFRVGGDNTFFSAGVLTHNCGVGSSLAGRGADILIIDDPHSEQDILAGNFDVFDKAYQWFTFGARTRLMPGGRVAIVQTRWSLDDLTGRVVRDMTQNDGADQYDVVEFPAILEIEQKDGSFKEKPLWPEFFDLPALHRTRASMPAFQWNAQYQQNPTSENAAVIKRDWWRLWTETDPPAVEYVIMSLDAAAEEKERADYTALTTWGVFFNEEERTNCLILLNSIKRRLEFPELKELAIREYRDWQPDAFIIEKKNSGTPLFQELRRTGLIVQEYTPHRGSGNKYARLQSVSDIVASGIVYVPTTRWAEELVEEIAGFPAAPHDDLVDSTVMALMRFRQGGFIRLPTDDAEDYEDYVPKKAAYY